MSTNTTALAEALEEFKRATAKLTSIWCDSDSIDTVSNYPSYLPSFDEFNCDVMEMSFDPPAPELPEMPPVGTIVRARYDLDGAFPSFYWPKGWTGEIVNIPTPDEGDSVEIRAHRYLGPGAHEWDNCRVIGLDDAWSHYDNVYGYEPARSADVIGLMALALLNEFEVVS